MLSDTCVVLALMFELLSGAGGGTLVPDKGIISELTLCFYYNHACVVHVNEAHNGQ